MQAYRAEQAGTVQTPYLIITGILLLLAGMLAAVKLDNREHLTVDMRPIAGFGASIWTQKWLLLGALGHLSVRGRGGLHRQLPDRLF